MHTLTRHTKDSIRKTSVKSALGKVSSCDFTNPELFLIDTMPVSSSGGFIKDVVPHTKPFVTPGHQLSYSSRWVSDETHVGNRKGHEQHTGTQSMKWSNVESKEWTFYSYCCHCCYCGSTSTHAPKSLTRNTPHATSTLESSYLLNDNHFMINYNRTSNT